MKHLILGNGNLGRDLFIKAAHSGDASLMSLSRGNDAFSSSFIQDVKNHHAQAVWYCIGAGEVAEAKREPARAEFLIRDLPILLRHSLHQEIALIVFSSDHAADEERPDDYTSDNPSPRSDYCRFQLGLERRLLELNRTRTAIIRVSTLYGLHKPLRTLPGSMLLHSNVPGEWPMEFPQNWVTPTPTRWLAHMLLENYSAFVSRNGTTRHHLAPTGNISIIDLAKLILPNEAIDKSEWYDSERPVFSNLDCSFGVENWHWFELWRHYYNADYFSKRAMEEISGELLSKSRADT